jgi:hypothetical protein
MAENKTKPSKVSVSSFLAKIKNAERRADCDTLVKLMSKITGQKPVMWGPSIVGFDSYHYKYDSGREGDMCIVGFGSGSAHLSIYVVAGFKGAETILEKLGKHKHSVSCLYVKRLSDIDLQQLEKLLVKSVAEIRKRYPG